MGGVDLTGIYRRCSFNIKEYVGKAAIETI